MEKEAQTGFTVLFEYVLRYIRTKEGKTVG